jgi:hypothetical protein
MTRQQLADQAAALVLSSAVAVDVELDLDDHRRHDRVAAIVQHHHGVRPVLGRHHLRQIDRPLLGALVIEHHAIAQPEQRRRELTARAKQIDEELVGERHHGRAYSKRHATRNPA